jgi:hypothetical protein
MLFVRSAPGRHRLRRSFRSQALDRRILNSTAEAIVKKSRLLFLASWIILLGLSVLITLGALGSLGTAYFSGQDSLTPAVGLEQITSIGGEEAADAFRGRRATAATWALAFGLLSLLVVLVPYRRSERWSWWALLISLGLSQLFSMGRVVMLGVSTGTGTAGFLFGFLMLGLLAGAPRMFSRQESAVDSVIAPDQ